MKTKQEDFNQVEAKKTIIEQVVGKQISLTKENVQKIASQIRFELETGSKDKIDFLTELEFLSQVFDVVKAELRESLIDELDKYPGDSVVRNGVQLRLKEAGVRYDFSTTEKWNIMNEQAEKIKAEIKQIEAQLKTIKSKQTIVDEETGELIELNVPIKSSKTTIEITLQNKNNS